MSETDEKYPIVLESLRLNTSLDFDLFLKPDDRNTYVLYRNKNLPFTEEVRARLLATGVSRLFVSLEDRPAYLAYVERHLQPLLADDSVPVRQKARLSYDVAAMVVDDILRTQLDENNLRRSVAVAAGTSQVVSLGRDAIHALVRLMPLDYDLHTHATNVSVLSTAIILELGVTDAGLMRATAFAGLLHDVGDIKRQPAEADSTIGGLPDDQGEHAVVGTRILEEHGITDPAVLRAVCEHHERFDGRGVPNGLEGEEISLIARIISVADWFDNLTTTTGDRPRRTSMQAAKIIIEQMQGFFDPVVVRRLILLLGPVIEKTRA